MTLTETRIEAGIYEMTNEAYQAAPGLSASGMKVLLEAPAKYKHQLGRPTYKDSYDFGSAWHKAVLGDDGEVLAIIDADSWRTKDAQAQRDAARAEGKIPLLAKDEPTITAMLAAFRANREAMSILDLENGAIEQSAFWEDPRTGVALRARFDYLPHAVQGKPFIIGDPKSAASSQPSKWIRTATDYGYHVQEAMYRKAVRDLGLHPRPEFAFLVQEKDAPYIVSVIRLDAHAQAIGDHLVAKAIDTYVRCTETGEWGGYVDDVYVASLPAYYTNQFEGEL